MYSVSGRSPLNKPVSREPSRSVRGLGGMPARSATNCQANSSASVSTRVEGGERVPDRDGGRTSRGDSPTGGGT